MEIFVDDETELTFDGPQWLYVLLEEQKVK
jgi:hypothetical protein